jgi:para-nitrobenzyl esterase
VSLTVETRYGRVRAAAERGVQVYRGIPYARPPLGPLRFRAPLPPEPWEGARECREFGAAAPQNPPRIPSLSEGAAARWSDDSLSLNISTPGLDGEAKPVLIWIHGGDFVAGSASKLGLTGRALARRGDVVVVTLQYRLGALGFLDPGGAGAANLGLQDQVAALEWVHSEIDAFGGDPANVTVFGTDAGAGCAAALLAMPQARRLFRRAILQSPVLHVWDREEAAEIARSFLAELGAPAASLPEIPTDQLLAAQQRLEQRLGADTDGWVFRPVVDGETLPSAPLATIRAGEAREHELIVGTNLDEARVRCVEDPAELSLSEAELQRRCAALTPDEASARLAIETYRGGRLGAATSPSSVWYAIESDRQFRYPATQLAEAQAASGARVFAYLFTWPSPLGGGVLGAFHGLEVPFVFGTRRHHGLRRFVGGGNDAKQLSHRMSDAWIGFAHSGEPSCPALGRWPAYVPPERRTLVLGTKPEVIDAPMEAERAFWDRLQSVP